MDHSYSQSDVEMKDDEVERQRERLEWIEQWRNACETETFERMDVDAESLDFDGALDHTYGEPVTERALSENESRMTGEREGEIAEEVGCEVVSEGENGQPATDAVEAEALKSEANVVEEVQGNDGTRFVVEIKIRVTQTDSGGKVTRGTQRSKRDDNGW